MEKSFARSNNKQKGLWAGSLLACVALSGCSISSYNTNPSDVQCDNERTIADLPKDSSTVFIVHGKTQEDTAEISVRRTGGQAALAIKGSLTGPQPALEPDGYTTPVPVTDGAELSAFAAGAAWVVDVRPDENRVVIQGTC